MLPHWLPLAPYLVVALGYLAWMRWRVVQERARRARLRELYPPAPASRACRVCGAPAGVRCDGGLHG